MSAHPELAVVPSAAKLHKPEGAHRIINRVYLQGGDSVILWGG